MADCLACLARAGDDGAPSSRALRQATRPTKPRAIVVSGLAAGAAFAAVLEADLRLTGRYVDDFIILGRPFVGRPFVADLARARLLGAAIHAVNSIALAALYATLAERIPGPPWLKGVIFATVENAALYPITYFEDLHPAIRAGEVDRYFNWPAFWQSVPRHIAYGAVLGVLYDLLRVKRHALGGR